MKKVVAILCLVAVLLAGCAEEIVPTDLRWGPDIWPIVERACIPCHSKADSLKGPNAHGINYETYRRVRKRRKEILRSVVIERSMPESNAVGIELTEDEVGRLARWIRGGAPR